RVEACGWRWGFGGGMYTADCAPKSGSVDAFCEGIPSRCHVPPAIRRTLLSEDRRKSESRGPSSGAPECRPRGAKPSARPHILVTVRVYAPLQAAPSPLVSFIVTVPFADVASDVQVRSPTICTSRTMTRSPVQPKSTCSAHAAFRSVDSSPLQAFWEPV